MLFSFLDSISVYENTEITSGNGGITLLLLIDAHIWYARQIDDYMFHIWTGFFFCVRIELSFD